MRRILGLSALAACLGSCASLPEGSAPALPSAYYRLMEIELATAEKRWAAQPEADLKTLESAPFGKHFPSAILVAAVLHEIPHPANPSFGNPARLAFALRVGDLLASEHEAGRFSERLDHHRDAYMWLEAFRLLERRLDDARRARWKKELEKSMTSLAADIELRKGVARYQSPFLGTSTNHFSLWASTLYLAGRVFGNPGWQDLGASVMRRIVSEQSPDGYWGEHSDAGPTTGYDYLTVTGVALYAAHSRDPEAVEALSRNTRFHLNFTWPDGVPVEVINDRNRHWPISSWGHFAFSGSPEGRRYAAFLTGFLRPGELWLEWVGRIAQNALYFQEGPVAPIPQDLERYSYRMRVPAGIRKSGPWAACLSGLISTSATGSQFYLDRQGHLSVWHRKVGLIISGANSKRQPELATFHERSQGQDSFMPESSVLDMKDSGDRLSLAYRSFNADLELDPPQGDTLGLRIRIQDRNRRDEGFLTFQLCLKPGETLETGTRSIVLGAEAISLGPEEIGGVLRHRGWELRVDPSARLLWPVYPFNPYANGPETDISKAVAALSVPLNTKLDGRYRRQEIRFTLSVPERRS